VKRVKSQTLATPLPKAKSRLEETLALHMRVSGIRFSREVRFHPERRWKFDFALVGCQVAVECEGGTRSGGRHVRGTGFEKDCEKYAEAAVLGWTVLRFTWNQIKSGYAIDTIERILRK